MNRYITMVSLLIIIERNFYIHYFEIRYNQYKNDHN